MSTGYQIYDQAQHLTALNEEQPEKMENWIHLVAKNATIFEDDHYLEEDMGVLIPVIQNSLANYGNHTQLDMFFDSWSQSRDHLNVLVPPAEQSGIIYNSDPAAYMLDYGTNVNYSFIDTALVAVPGFQPLNYLNLVSSVLGINVTAIKALVRRSL